MGQIPQIAEGSLRSAWGSSELWDGEYDTVRSIPSTLRLRPSHAFKRLEPMMQLRPGMRVLDAGAGAGRHSLYLAEKGCTVDAIDTSRSACALLEERRRDRPDLSGSIRVERATLGPTDVTDDSYDLIIDSYVSCHLLSEDERRTYLESLMGRLRPGGRLYTACMGRDDSYYSDHVVDDSGPHSIARDPCNGVAKLLQHRVTFREPLGELGPFVATAVESFDDQVADRMERRQVLAALLGRTASPLAS